MGQSRFPAYPKRRLVAGVDVACIVDRVPRHGRGTLVVCACRCGGILEEAVAVGAPALACAVRLHMLAAGAPEEER